ncbi:MAG: heme-binding beta-barrel domain-containing protein [Cellvibrionaceae bacterium]
MNDTADYGPLAALIGRWEGEQGTDIAPEPDGTENNPYYEFIEFYGEDDTDNAETQELVIVRYHQQVRRKSNGKVFHDQVGYWLWDKDANQVVHSFTIPRGVAVIAGGQAEKITDGYQLRVKAKKGDLDWGVLETPFMRDNASTTGFEMELTVTSDTLNYMQTTTVDIYGREGFEHTDTNTLKRVSEYID